MPISGAARARLTLLGGAGLVLAYGLVLFSNASFAIAGREASGYANQARVLLTGSLTEPIAALVRLGLPQSEIPPLLPAGFVPAAAPGRGVSAYPVGPSAAMAVASLLAGAASGPFVAGPVSAFVALLALYLIARELGLPRELALSAAAMLALYPPFVRQSVQPSGDAFSVGASLIAILLALHSRRGAGWSAAAGAAFALSVWMRPGNVVLALPVLFLIALRGRSVVALVVGAAPLAALLLAVDSRAFGSPFATGDPAGAGPIGLLSLRFPSPGLAALPPLLALLTPLPLLGWAGAAADRKIPARQRAALAAWFLGFLLLDVSSASTPSWSVERAVLPGVPALVLASLLLLRDAIRARAAEDRAPRWRGAAAAGLVLLVLILEASALSRLRVFATDDAQRRVREAAVWALDRLPGNALVLAGECGGALRFQSDRTTIDSDRLRPDVFARITERARRRGFPIYALAFEAEAPRVLEGAPGAWARVERRGAVGLWRLPAGEPGS